VVNVFFIFADTDQFT